MLKTAEQIADDVIVKMADWYNPATWFSGGKKNVQKPKTQESYFDRGVREARNPGQSKHDRLSSMGVM
jgi:hypothetical protein